MGVMVTVTILASITTLLLLIMVGVLLWKPALLNKLWGPGKKRRRDSKSEESV